MDYTAYLELFDSGDRRELVRRFCTDDVIFEAGSLKQVHRGKDEVIRFLLRIQDGLREVLRPQVILQNDNYIFVEADVDIHAQRDLPDNPAGALKKGEYVTMKALVVYYLRDDKICRFKTALWPANFGVTEPATSAYGPQNSTSDTQAKH
jgi:SnoaL-like domain